MSTALRIRSWASPTKRPFAEPVFITDADDLPDDLANMSLILPTRGLDRAAQCLARGAAQVLLADAALRDSAQIKILAERFGAPRIGVWLPVKRVEVRWTMDVDSNADFKCLVPSMMPSWEVLRSDFTRTGTEAGWWIDQMQVLGASTVLVSVDMADDQDLNICAGLIERFTDRLWFAPLTDTCADLRPWLEFGQVRQLALPEAAFGDTERIAALHAVWQAPEESAA